MRYHTLLAICLLLTGCNDCGSDPTFMKVCRDGDSFTYPIGDAVAAPRCETPLEEIVWPSMPLKVAMDVELIDFDESLDEALNFWERGVDFHMFVRSGPVDADVVIMSGSAGDPGLAAMHHEIVDGKLIAFIEVRKPGDITEMVYVLAHELGHTVGLAHDPQSWSIMHGKIESFGLVEDPNDPDPDPFPSYFVTDNDHEALRARYAP